MIYQPSGLPPANSLKDSADVPPLLIDNKRPGHPLCAPGRQTTSDLPDRAGVVFASRLARLSFCLAESLDAAASAASVVILLSGFIRMRLESKIASLI